MPRPGGQSDGDVVLWPYAFAGTDMPCFSTQALTSELRLLLPPPVRPPSWT
jgi:hypothetical protein